MRLSSISKLLTLSLLVLSSFTSQASVTQYIPVNLNSTIERDIDRLLIYAGMANARKPLAVHMVKKALEKCPEADSPAFCGNVSSYLTRFDGDYGVTHAQVTVGWADKEGVTLANQRGQRADDTLSGSINAFYKVTDSFAVNVGGIASDSMNTLEGTYLSYGNESVQLDVGYKSRWLSPMNNSAALMSTNAETYFTVGLSNSTPIDWLAGFTYDLSWGKLSTSDKIKSGGVNTTGEPNIIAMQVALTPVDWFTVGLNRTMQFGGGGRGEPSLGDILAAFFCPPCVDHTFNGENSDDEFGNQQIAAFSKFTFDTKVPFSLYAEYAGEDTADASLFKFGNVMASAGIDFPILFNAFDLQVEGSKWQNAWYSHHLYGDGMTNNGQVLGHWAFSKNTMGKWGNSQQVTAGWQYSTDTYFNISYKAAEFEETNGQQISHSHAVTFKVSHRYMEYLTGLQLDWGTDHIDSNVVHVRGSVTW